MTEDDTFRRLKRVPFEEVERCVDCDLVSAERSRRLKEGGWTWEEFGREWNRRYGRN